MTVGYETERKRYLEGTAELLRTEITLPVLRDGEGYEDFHKLYRELAEHSRCFAETVLFPRLKEAYGALSEDDRKFRAPKQKYTVVAYAEASGEGEALTVCLTVTLRGRTGITFEASDVQYWAMRRGKLLLVPPPRGHSSGRMDREKGPSDPIKADGSGWIVGKKRKQARKDTICS